MIVVVDCRCRRRNIRKYDNKSRYNGSSGSALIQFINYGTFCAILDQCSTDDSFTFYVLICNRMYANVTFCIRISNLKFHNRILFS